MKSQDLHSVEVLGQAGDKLPDKDDIIVLCVRIPMFLAPKLMSTASKRKRRILTKTMERTKTKTISQMKRRRNKIPPHAENLMLLINERTVWKIGTTKIANECQ